MTSHAQNNPRMGVATTQTVAMACMAMDQLMNRAHGMPGIGVLYGRPGLGKTSALTRLAHPTDYNCAYVRCRSFDSKKSLAEMILKELGIQLKASWSMSTIFDITSEQFSIQNRPLVVDEADYIAEKAAIELLRDLHDTGLVPMLLVGEERIKTKLAEKHERFHDRVLVWSQAQPADESDLDKLLLHYTPSLKLNKEARLLLLAKTSGVARKVVTSLHALSESAKVQGLELITADEVMGVL